MSYFMNCFGRKIFYTEDDIVVRKLFIKYERLELQIEDLRKHFARFGDIEDIQLFDMPPDKQERTGYVLFQGCRDAADVLVKVMHFVCGYRVHVKPYYSWGQPGVQDIEPSDYSIARLNDDCLERIYHYLPLPDQLNLARLCGRCPALYRSINLGILKSMSLWNVRDFFIYFGSKLREIEGPMPQILQRHLCDFLGEHCSNLRILRISQIVLSEPDMYKLFSQQLLQLEELQLHCVNFNDEYLPALSSLRYLRKLIFCFNDILTGKHMDCLPSCIESLNLLYCAKLQFALLPGICKALPHLRDLSVRITRPANADSFRQMVEDNCCNCLESLTIHCDSITPKYMEYLAKFPSMSKLVLYKCQTSSLFNQWLIEHKRQQLVHFVINNHRGMDLAMLLQICQLSALRVLALPLNDMLDDGVMEQLGQLSHLENLDLRWCKNITENGVLRLLHECGKLHKLQLEYCPHLGEQLVHNMIRQLTEEVQLQKRKQKQTQRQLPVKLTVCGKQFSKSLLEHPRVALKDMVDVELGKEYGKIC